MAGKITVITGPMRSRKTLDLILMAREAELVGKKVISFHPKDSSRWGDGNEIVSRVSVRSHVGDVTQEHRLSFPSIPLGRLSNGEYVIPMDADLVLFDDAHFFNTSIISLVCRLRQDDIDVAISGLDMDCFQQPFGCMPYLMAIADEVIKQKTSCMKCGGAASISFRQDESQEQILVGDTEYISMCWDCWYYHMNERDQRFADNLVKKGHI